MPVSMAFRYIKPRRSFRTLADKVGRQLNTLQRDAERIKKDFESTTATWSHKPKFEIKFQPWPLAGSISAVVYTDDLIYHFVDKGTKPHVIVPRRARALSFQWGGPGSYKAKTRPGVIGSRSGGPSGPQVHRMHVRHPGTEARNFTEIIQKKWQKRLPASMRDALRKGVMEW